MTGTSSERLGGRIAAPHQRFGDSDDPAREFPKLTIVKREPFHKWLYLVSGGLRLNTRVPRALAKRLVRLDQRVERGNRLFGLFALIVVDRTT